MKKYIGLDVVTGAIIGAATGQFIAYTATSSDDSDSDNKKENDATFKQVCVGVGALIGSAVSVAVNLLDESK